MEAAARHRLLLSLRSEQAMGLRSIPRGSDFEIAAPGESPARESHEEATVSEVAPARSQGGARSVRETSSDATDALFGQPAVPPAKPVSLPTAAPFDAPLLSLEEKQ